MGHGQFYKITKYMMLMAGLVRMRKGMIYLYFVRPYS
jgi:hypothetical protein